MKVKMNIKAGAGDPHGQHNEKLVSNKKNSKGLKVKTNVRSGSTPEGHNHNEAMLFDREKNI